MGSDRSIGGLSMVVLIPQRPGDTSAAPIALDGIKIFCIEGQTLQANSRYASEDEDWRETQYLGSAEGFLVTDSIGRRFKYGPDPQSRLPLLMAPSSNGVFETTRIDEATEYHSPTRPYLIL